MKLQIKVNPDTGIIEDAKFKTFGCGSAIASSSLATEWLKGKTVDEALAIKNTDIVEELSLPPVKIHCSVLAEDAIKAAISDYKRKQQGARRVAGQRRRRSRMPSRGRGWHLIPGLSALRARGGERGAFCPECGRDPPLGGARDYFGSWGLPRKLKLDPAELEQRYRALSRQLHPDSSTTRRRPSGERASSGRRS